MNKRWQSACRIHHAVDVCKPPEGAVFKRYGTERSGKRCRYKRYQVSVKKLNASESLKTCRKGLFVDKTIGIVVLIGGLQRINCLLAVGQPALRRQELYTTCPDPSGGFYSERERLPC